MPRSTKGRAAARGLDARLSLQHASCLLEMLHSKQLRSIKMLLDSNHGIYREKCATLASGPPSRLGRYDGGLAELLAAALAVAALAWFAGPQ